MTRLLVRLMITAMCGAILCEIAPMLAQGGLRSRDDLATAQKALVVPYPAAVIASTRLVPDTDSDDIIADLALETLSNGMVVMSGNVRRSQDITTPPTTRPSIFVIADRNRNTYRAFRVRGAVEDNQRVKDYLKLQHGVDWDANRRLAPPRRAAALSGDPTVMRHRTSYPTRKFPSTFRPKLLLVSAANTDTVSCSVTADLNIETRDIFGYGFLLARSRSYAAIATDYNPEWPGGEQIWSFSFSDQFPQNPTGIGTHWFKDGGSSEVEYYSDIPLLAISSQDTTYYNDDFGSSTERTWAWHYIYSSADRTSIPFRVGYKNESGEFSSLIASNLVDWSWSGCSYY